MIKRPIFAHHFHEGHFVGFRVENFSLCVFYIELRCPRAFEVSGISKNDFGLCRDVTRWKQTWNISLRRLLNKIINFIQRLLRHSSKVELFRLIDNHLLNAWIQLNVLVEIKAIDRRKLNGRIRFVIITISLLILIALEHVGLTSRPMELKNFLDGWMKFFSVSWFNKMGCGLKFLKFPGLFKF